MLCNKADHVIIDQPFLPLTGIHQAFFAHTVDHPRNTVGDLIYLINGVVCEDILFTSGIFHMRIDIPFAFGSVQCGKCTVHVYPLADGRITLKANLLSQSSVCPHNTRAIGLSESK